MPPALVRPYVTVLPQRRTPSAAHVVRTPAATRAVPPPYQPRHAGTTAPTVTAPPIAAAVTAGVVPRPHRRPRHHPALAWTVLLVTLASTGLALEAGDRAATSAPDGGPVTAAQAGRLQTAVVPAPAVAGLAPAAPALGSTVVSTAEPSTESTAGPAAGAVVGPAGLCLDARATAIQLHRCTGATGQAWTAPADGTLRTAGRCLQPAAYRLVLVRCTGAAAQQWDVARGALVARSLRQCLTGRGAEAYLAACTGGASQRWRLP